MEEEPKPMSLKLKTYAFMTSMLVFGTANIIIQDEQNQTKSAGALFTHPWMQCSFMFIGEFSVLGAYGVKKWYYNRQVATNPTAAPMSPGALQAGEKQLKSNPSPLLLAIPAAFDFTASSLMFVALTMTPASIYQMMRGFVTVFTAVFAMIFLKKKQYRHHLLGLICIVVALFSVGLVAIFVKTDDDSGDDNLVGSIPLGIVLIIVAQVFAAALFIVEEYFIGDYYLDPFKVVGLEGMWGFLYFLVALPIYQAISCDFFACNYGFFENSSYAFYQMTEEPVIIVYTFGIMLSIAFFNVSGVTTTKLASAAQRATVDSTRTVTIWFMSVALGLEVFQWQVLPGFVLLVFGTLVYNEILVLPFLGFNEWTKEAIEARDGAEKRDANYMATSPGAAYSSQRNQRLLQKANDKHYDAVGEGDEDFNMNASDDPTSSKK